MEPKVGFLDFLNSRLMVLIGSSELDFIDRGVHQGMIEFIDNLLGSALPSIQHDLAQCSSISAMSDAFYSGE